MRLVHVVPSYWPAVRYGGPIFSVHGLCRALAKNHDVMVLTTDRDGPGRLDVPTGEPVDVDGVSVIYFPTSSLRRLFHAPALAAAAPRYIQRSDLLHTHSVFLWPTTVAARAAIRLEVPFVNSPRGMLVRDLIEKRSRVVKKIWLALVERRNIEKAAALHFTSELERREAKRLGYGSDRDFVIGNGVDVEDTDSSTYRSAAQELAGRGYGRYVLYLGRLNWKKGIEHLVTAMARVPEVNLVLAGLDDGNQRNLQELVKRTGIAERVFFPGPAYGVEKAALMANATVFVLPSSSENFGNAALEAMAYGAPVIVSPEVGVAEHVESARTGLVCEPDPESLALALQKLLEEPAQARAMGINGKKMVREKFSWDGLAVAMERQYAKIIERTGSRRGSRAA